jgi:hypothetical protein
MSRFKLVLWNVASRRIAAAWALFAFEGGEDLFCAKAGLQMENKMAVKSVTATQKDCGAVRNLSNERRELRVMDWS